MDYPLCNSFKGEQSLFFYYNICRNDEDLRPLIFSIIVYVLSNKRIAFLVKLRAFGSTF